MGNKSKRVLSSLVGVPVIAALTVYGNKWLFGACVLFLILLASHEFFEMLKKADIPVVRPAALAGTILLPLGIFAYNLGFVLFTLVFTAFAAMLFKLYSKTPLDDTFQAAGTAVLAVLYVPLFFSFVYLLWDLSFHLVFMLFITIWASDTFAYIFGMKFGKRRLYERISPKKSIEGLIAGYIGGVGAASSYAYIFDMSSPFHVVFSAFLVVTAGVAGDLVESMFKRSAGIKDSGSLIPGHGGVLDRVDSMLYGAPVLFFYIHYMAL